MNSPSPLTVGQSGPSPATVQVRQRAAIMRHAIQRQRDTGEPITPALLAQCTTRVELDAGALARFEETNRTAPCTDCGMDVFEGGEYAFMLHHRVWWDLTVERHATFLCVGCITTRLGRPLALADFDPDVPLNDPKLTKRRSPRLQAILEGR